MQSVKRPGRSARSRRPVLDPEPEGVEPGDLDAESAESTLDDEDSEYAEGADVRHVNCPDCAQPIALLADEDVFPEHALCPTPWNPFGLQVCPGTGRPATAAHPAHEDPEAQQQDTAVLLTLPQGLDWRTQPFSHVGGPGSRPLRVPRQRSAAA